MSRTIQPKPNQRSYRQRCGLAIAMDCIGERWTWLIIRGLLTGPKRFGELESQLPGIGSNLLASRLKQLTSRGIAEKSGRGRQAAYQLTELGEELRTVAHTLINWGRRLPVAAPEGSIAMPEWDMLAFEAAFIPESAVDRSAVIELTLSDFIFHLVIRSGGCSAVAGAAARPDVQVVTSTSVLVGIGQRDLSVELAKAKGLLTVSGDPDKFAMLFECFA